MHDHEEGEHGVRLEILDGLAGDVEHRVEPSQNLLDLAVLVGSPLRLQVGRVAEQVDLVHQRPHVGGGRGVEANQDPSLFDHVTVLRVLLQEAVEIGGDAFLLLPGDLRDRETIAEVGEVQVALVAEVGQRFGRRHGHVERRHELVEERVVHRLAAVVVVADRTEPRPGHRRGEFDADLPVRVLGEQVGPARGVRDDAPDDERREGDGGDYEGALHGGLRVRGWCKLRLTFCQLGLSVRGPSDRRYGRSGCFRMGNIRREYPIDEPMVRGGR